MGVGTPKTSQHFVKVHWISVGGLTKQGGEREGKGGRREGREEGRGRRGKEKKRKEEVMEKGLGTQADVCAALFCAQAGDLNAIQDAYVWSWGWAQRGGGACRQRMSRRKWLPGYSGKGRLDSSLAAWLGFFC